MTAKKLTAEELAVKMEMGNHDWADDAVEMLRQQQAEIEALKPYKEKIEMMERAYDDHIKKSMGEVKDLIKKASKK